MEAVSKIHLHVNIHLNGMAKIHLNGMGLNVYYPASSSGLDTLSSN